MVSLSTAPFSEGCVTIKSQSTMEGFRKNVYSAQEQIKGSFTFISIDLIEKVFKRRTERTINDGSMDNYWTTFVELQTDF